MFGARPSRGESCVPGMWETKDPLARMAAKVARELLYIPIVHTAADMGSAAGPLQAAWEQQLGKGWEQHQAEVASYWRRARDELFGYLEAKLGGRDAGCERVRIYQDGLPVGGEQARRIAEQVAARGSENYQIVQVLLERGAQLEQTEQAELLKEEYGLIRQVLAAQTPEEMVRRQRRYQERAAALLDERDEFIAGAIDRTLRSGEIGVLFIGALHQIAPKLPADIAVTFLPRQVAGPDEPGRHPAAS